MKTLLRSIAAAGLALAILIGVAPAASAATTPPSVDTYVSRSKFYPTVRDGYRDSVRIDIDAFAGSWSDEVIETIDVRIEDVNRGGVVFERTFYGSDRALHETIKWNGSGARVGEYEIVAHATSNYYRAASGLARVEIATGERTQRRWIERNGVETSSRSGAADWTRLSGGTLLSTVGYRESGTATYSLRAPRGYEVASVGIDWRRGIWGSRSVRVSKDVDGRRARVSISHSIGAQIDVSQIEIDGAWIKATKIVRI